VRVKDFSQAIALLMIYLIISLTFFSAMVFGYIANPQAYGQDKVPGITRQTDTVVFKAESTFPLSITSYFTNNNPVAMSCSGANGNFNCSYSTSVNSVTGVVSATLRENSPGTDSASVAAYPDFIPPSIQNMVGISMGNMVRAVFTIRDQSSPSYPNTCSGFKKVELLVNNQVANNISYPPGTCYVEGEITGTIPNFVGEVTTSLRVTDYVGFTTSYNGNSVTIYSKKPIIRQGVKVYKAGTTAEVRQASTTTNFVMSVDVSIEIESAALSPSGSVFGDFANFDKTNSIDQSNVAADCEMPVASNTLYICTFSNIRLSPAGLRTNFTVSVTDQMDNFANATLPTTFTEHAGATIGAAKIYKTGTTDEIRIISVNASSLQRRVDISVDITDSVDASAVGNFEQIHRNLGIGQDSVQTQCYLNEEVAGATTSHYTCLFQNLIFNPAVINPKITIRVTDEIGKVTEKNLTLGFTPVNNGGTVTRLGPEPSRCVAGTCYVRSTGNNITAEISGGSTYLDSYVRLQDVPAACAQENSRWICRQYISFNLNDNKLYLQGNDDLGNPIAAVTNITVDNDAPVKLTNFTSSPRCPISSETLKISMNVSEQKSPGVIISADTSAISSKEITIGSCTKIGNTKNFQCILSVTSLRAEEINTELQIVVEDLAGNRIEGIDPLPVSICIAVDEIPDMIEQVQTTGTLPRVDKKTADKITVKTAVGLEIVLNNDEAEVVDRTKPQCAGPGLTGSAYTISDIGLNPIIVLPLKYNEAWDENDQVVINCSQQFTIKIGNRIYTGKEQENYTITLTAYNQPLGSLSKVYETKVKEIKNNIRSLDRSIKKYDKIGKTLHTICTFAEGLGKANQVLQSARVAMMLLCTIPFFGQTLFQTISKLADKFNGFVQNNIWPQRWEKTGHNSQGLLIKTVCFIYTCKFYDINELAVIAISMAEGKFLSAASPSVQEKGPPQLNYDQATQLDPNSDPRMWSTFNGVTTGQINGVWYDFDRNTGILNINPMMNVQPSEIQPTTQTGAAGGGGTQVSANARGSGFNFGPIHINLGGQSNMWTPQDIAQFETDVRFNNAVDAFLGDQGSWIYNPFKSKHYDSLCHPAIVFNKRKEMQLLCKRLGCIKLMASNGGPIDACEYDYSLGMCLYVDSARYKLQGGASFFKIIDSALRALFSNFLGSAATFAFWKLCEDQPSWGLACDPSKIPKNICTAFIALQSFKEVASFISNPYNPLKSSGVPTDPIKQSGGPDFCAGVDWKSE